MVADKKRKGELIVGLARKAVEEYVHNGKEIEPSSAEKEALAVRRGVFVSLKNQGQLRGCIGTIEPVQENLAREIIKNAISACGHDPRFSPVRPEELSELDISVDVLGEKETIDGLEQLNPEKYGVIVKKGRRTGLLLPDLDGVDSSEKQVEIACKKAGVTYGADVQLYRFKVQRYN